MSRILGYVGVGLLAFVGGYIAASTSEIQSGHLTSDNKIDIVVRDNAKQNHIHLGNGNGTFTSMDKTNLSSEQKQKIRDYVKECFNKKNQHTENSSFPGPKYLLKKELVDYFNF